MRLEVRRLGRFPVPPFFLAAVVQPAVLAPVDPELRSIPLVYLLPAVSTVSTDRLATKKLKTSTYVALLTMTAAEGVSFEMMADAAPGGPFGKSSVVFCAIAPLHHPAAKKARRRFLFIVRRFFGG